MVQFSNNRSIHDGSERMRERAETRRHEILKAAARVFRRQGFEATGMREIAAEAGLSPGNLYHYFKGKQDILFFCQDRSLESLLAALDGAKLSRADPGTQLHAVIAAHVRCLLDEMQGSSAHWEVDALPEQQRQAIVAKRDRYERGLRQIVARGVKSGAFTSCDPKLVTRAILGAANWTARWYRPEGRQSASAVAEAIAEYLVRGLAQVADHARDHGVQA